MTWPIWAFVFSHLGAAIVGVILHWIFGSDNNPPKGR